MSWARNQGHRCLPTRAGRSGQCHYGGPSPGDLSMGLVARACLMRCPPVLNRRCCRVARDRFLGEVWVNERG